MKKRVVISSVLVSVFMLGIIARIGYIALSGVYAVSGSYNSYSLTLDTLEPNIYYSNYERLTNNKQVKYALLKPNAKTLAELPLLFNNTDEIIDELKYGKPLLVKTDKSSAKYIKLFNVTSSENTCKQLLSKESSGLLSYLPDSIGSKKLKYSVDALGRMLSGDEGEIVDENYNSSEGLLLTLDKRVQEAAYIASKDIKSGCVIVMDAKSSSILACVTRPDSAYVNKPFTLYSVGSVYKLIIAACALENGINPEYNCEGKIRVGDAIYSCQKNHKHGKQHLKEALANSCNCYFVNLALRLGAEKILEESIKFGFDNDISIYKDWTVKGSVLPDLKALQAEGELPLIAFGQGSLMTTPLQFCRALCAISNGGYLNDVKLVTAEVDKFGNRSLIEYDAPKQIISAKTSYLLLEYMRYTVTNGTASAAKYNNSSAGKTATAQTGQYVNGKEQLNTWFAGVYPYNEPKYAIVVMTENGTSGARDCCPVFRTIVEMLD